MSHLETLKNIYTEIKKDINARLKLFKKIREHGDDKAFFIELVFCLLTPQSKAKTCWKVVENLVNKNVLFKGNKNRILREVNVIRFKNNKTGYILQARRQFYKNGEFRLKSLLSKFNYVREKRDWLVENIKGIGYKEASHFLRNIGCGDDIAILDRHILKNLKLLNVISDSDIPGTLSKKQYLLIEKKMKKFSKKINIPLSHLDLLLWYKETNEIFK